MDYLINLALEIKKYPGKGGWHYVTIPEIKLDRKGKFGWVNVSGFVDDYPILKYKLMPIKGGGLFFPIKAEIRKVIKKTEGDIVSIKLHVDNSPFEITEEILDCFEMEKSSLLNTFKSFSESNQRYYLDWIYEAKNDDTKARRISKMMENLELGKKFYD